MNIPDRNMHAVEILRRRQLADDGRQQRPVKNAYKEIPDFDGFHRPSRLVNGYLNARQ